MLYRITNNGEARTVDFLAVFAKGETREFTENEVENWKAMAGVAPVNALPDNFEIEFITVEEDKEVEN